MLKQCGVLPTLRPRRQVYLNLKADTQSRGSIAPISTVARVRKNIEA